MKYYIFHNTDEYCREDDNRVKSTLSKYDINNNGYLLLENFLYFYYEACKDRP